MSQREFSSSMERRQWLKSASQLAAAGYFAGGLGGDDASKGIARVWNEATGLRSSHAAEVDSASTGGNGGNGANGGTGANGGQGGTNKAAGTPRTLRVAAINSVYRLRSHAYHLCGRVIHGYQRDGFHHQPRLKLARMYNDQTPAEDLGREYGKRYGVDVCDSVEASMAITQ
jgi:hypothetical protein